MLDLAEEPASIGVGAILPSARRVSAARSTALRVQPRPLVWEVVTSVEVEERTEEGESVEREDEAKRISPM